MNYSSNKDQVIFIKDRDIVVTMDAKSIDGDTVTLNGIPSFDLLSAQVNRLNNQDNTLFKNIKQLSADLSSDIYTLSAKLCIDIDNKVNAINEKEDRLSLALSTEIRKLSADLSTDVDILSAKFEDRFSTIESDIKGGVNYRGHLSANSSSQFPDGTPYDLSTIFASYYDLMNDSKELTADKVLSNGWLYNFTTTDITGFTTRDGVALENNDYIIIHKHDKDSQSFYSLSVSEITRENVDLIEAVQDDYIRFHQFKGLSDELYGKLEDADIKSNSLCAYLSADVYNLSVLLSADIKNLSAALSTDIVTLSSNAYSKILDLSDMLSSDISCLSVALSTEISTTVVVVSTDNEIVGNNLSVIKVTNSQYDDLVRLEQTSPTGLYVIDDYYKSLRGMQLKDLGAPTAENDAVTKKYVDDLSAVCKADVDTLSNALCSEVTSLSGSLSTSVNAEFVHISGDTITGDLCVRDRISADSFVAGDDTLAKKTTLSADRIHIVDKTSLEETKTYDLVYPLKNGTFALVDDVEQLSSEVKDLSGTLDTDIKNLSTDLSTDVALSTTDIRNDITFISADLSSLEQKHYNVTLSSIETQEHSHTEGKYPDNLLITDHFTSEEMHDQYYLKFAYGSLVLKKIQ